MATIHSLPPELFIEIFEPLYQQDLARVSLVCRSWRDLARSSLLHTVLLSTDEQAHQWLASSVRQIYSTASLRMSDFVRQGTGLKVLEACPDLRSLAPWDSDRGGYDWCTSASLKNLQSLDILYPEDFPPDAAPLPHRLRHLELNVEPYITPDKLQCIFYSSKETLESLRIDFTYPATSMEYLNDFFADETFPNVRSVTVRVAYGFCILSHFLRWFPSLRSLRLQSDTNEAQDKHDTFVASIVSVGAHATRNLKSLSFEAIHLESKAPAMYETILQLIKLPNLEGLRQLNLAGSPRSAFEGPAGLALLEECEERSISVLCRYGYLTFEMMAKEGNP